MDLRIFSSITESDHLGYDWLEWNDKHKVFHPACDLNGKGGGDSDLGNPFYSPLSGQVIFVSKPATLFNSNGGFGNHFVIFHPIVGLSTHWVHCNKIYVKDGERVKRGQELGEVGKTGTTTAHLHFEVWTERLLEIQQRHTKPYHFYPTGKSRAWVEEYYFSPYQFMENVLAINKAEKTHWAAPYEQDLIAAGLLEQTKPLDQPPTRAELYKFISLLLKHGKK